MRDFFRDTAIGRAAMKKFGDVPENFKIYEAGWIEHQDIDNKGLMFVRAAEFRKALKGPNKGEFCIIVPGTKKLTHITSDEIKAMEETLPTVECNECGWSGSSNDCRMLRGADGGIGPLCPDCGETCDTNKGGA